MQFVEICRVHPSSMLACFWTGIFVRILSGQNVRTTMVSSTKCVLWKGTIGELGTQLHLINYQYNYLSIIYDP